MRNSAVVFASLLVIFIKVPAALSASTRVPKPPYSPQNYGKTNDYDLTNDGLYNPHPSWFKHIRGQKTYVSNWMCDGQAVPRKTNCPSDPAQSEFFKYYNTLPSLKANDWQRNIGYDMFRAVDVRCAELCYLPDDHHHACCKDVPFNSKRLGARILADYGNYGCDCSCFMKNIPSHQDSCCDDVMKCECWYSKYTRWYMYYFDKGREFYDLTNCDPSQARRRRRSVRAAGPVCACA